MGDVIGMSADDKQRRRRLLSAALQESRAVEKAIIEGDRLEDDRRTEELAQHLGSVVRSG